VVLSRRQFLDRFLRQCACLAALGAGGMLWPAAALSEPKPPKLTRGLLRPKLSPFFERLPDKRVRCTLCPRRCVVACGARGACEVRENRGGDYYSLTYANPCAVHIDPVEKKPFFHVLPATLSFSLATAGCNFDCKFCQNWEISQARPEATLNYDLPPAEAVAFAKASGCRTLASTYVEPTIFIEYMLDLAQACKHEGILKVMHSNGYIEPGPLAALIAAGLAAACIDLKGFSEGYYQGMCEGSLAPVLASLKQLRRAGVFVEVVNLVVPGANDAPKEVAAMCGWLKRELGPDTPLHFSRFQPLYKLRNLPPTPVETLTSLRELALRSGLSFVYVGNVPGHPGENTTCPKCKRVLIRRAGYEVLEMKVAAGKCPGCGRPIPGIWT
jgi:pyruvate formate lyase activating enzyme